MRAHWVLCLCVAGLTSSEVVSSPQAPPVQTPQQAPTFRANIDVARITVRVLDRDRRPVRGLTEQDFEVFVDGKPQRIVAVDADEATPPARPAAAWVRDVAPDIATNDLVEPRLIVIILDDAIAGSGGRTTILGPGSPFALKQAKLVAHEIVRHLGPRDMASVVFTADNNEPQDFTRDHARLRAAIERFNPPMVPERLAPLYSVGTIRRALEMLREVPDVRSAIFWIGGGGKADPELLTPTMAPRPSADSDIAQREVALGVRATVAAMAGSSHLSSVPVYPVSTIGILAPTGPAGGGIPSPVGDESSIAGATGGRFVAGTNTPAAEIPEIFEELSVQYTIGYQIDGLQNDGRFRRVQVRVKRPDVIIEPPTRGFFAPTQRNVDRATRNLTVTAPTTRAIAGLIPLADEPLRLAVAPFWAPPIAGKKDPPSLLTLSLGIGATPTTYIRETVQVEVRVFDGEGRVQVARRLHTAAIPASANQPRDLLSSIRLKPGRYNVRVSVHRAQERRSGSVYTDVMIPDFEKARLSVSGVAVLAKPAHAVTRADGYETVLPAPPTTLREFVRDTEASLFLRVHAGGGRPLDRATVTAAIVDELNANVFSKTDALRLTPAGADYRFTLPLDRLSPGKFVARLTITADGVPPQQRDVRFQITR